MTQQQTVISDFQVSSGAYMRCLASMVLADNWLWMVLPLAVCAMLAIWIDVRFIIVACMVLFIVLPMVLALLYFHYGFSQPAQWSIMAKDAIISPSGIELHFQDPRMHRHSIAWSDVRTVVQRDDACLLMLRRGRYTFFMIPLTALDPAAIALLHQLVQENQ